MFHYATDAIDRWRHGAALWRPILLLCLLAALGAIVRLPTPASAQANSSGSSPATLAKSFDVAARHWGVPAQIVMAVGYVETHWAQRPGEPSIDKGYGIMHLVDGPGQTLELASRLSGLPVDALRMDATANIEGGAAVLRDISHKLDPEASETTLSTWYEAVANYSRASDPFVRDGYAREVYRALVEGVTATLDSGETLTLEPTAVGDLPEPLQPAPSSDDYGPALWVPASPSNYTVGRQYGPLNFIIIHDTEGSYASAISWFQNPLSQVSAHYVIRSADGQITQMVREANTAWHAGNWDYNVRSVGIEHEGYMNQPGWYTEAMYQASSALARHVADRYGVKKDRAHVIGHYQVPGSTHTDPGPYWDWSHYMSLIRRDSVRSALVDNTDPGFVPVPTPVDPQHYWQIFGGGYNGSNTYQTLSVADQQSSVNSGTWSAQLPSTGLYDVYAFVPWVDNNTPDTASARYSVLTSSGWQTALVSQKAITDVGNGSWAHLGVFNLNGGTATQVRLTDYTGEWGRNVWFDAVMWIPSTGGTPPPTNTPAARTATRTPTGVPRTNTPTPRPTNTFTPTPIPPTFTPGPCGINFSDLPDTHWAYSYVVYLYCNGVITGYGDGTFRPGANTTRAQISKMLVVSIGWTLYNPIVPDFTDVQPSNPYYQYIETCYVRGIITGYADGTFRPASPVTRAQVTKMIVLAKHWTPEYPAQPDFSDVAPSNWAYGYVEACYRRSIISGYADGTFRPGNAVNRAQFSKMLTLAVQQPLGPDTPSTAPVPSK